MKSIFLIWLALSSALVFSQTTNIGNYKVVGNLSSTQDVINGYASTATAGGTTVLTVLSAGQQFFTGSTNQTCQLPVVSTLTLGQAYKIVNNSSGTVTVNSSGGNTIQAMAANSQIEATVIAITGTGTASWSSKYSSQGLTPALSNGNIFVGNSSNIAAAVVMSGDATISNSGVVALRTAGTPGTYLTAITDSNGRVTSGNNTLSNANFWLGSGSSVATPVVMSGDATMNNAGSVSLKTMSPGVGGLSYLAVVTDANGRVTSGNNTLASTDFWLGNGSNIATPVTLSGDATLGNSGVIALKTMSPGVGGVAYGGVVTDANGRVTSGSAVNTNGQLFIGNSTSGGGTVATLTQGTNITITNGPGSITIASSGAAAPTFTYVSQSSTLNPAVLSDWYVLSGSSFNITLPDATASSSAGKIIVFQHNGTSLTQIYTFLTTSAQTINGPGGTVASGSYALYTNGEALWLFDDGANWQVVEHKTTTGWNSPGTISLSATSAYVFTVTSANATVGATYTNSGQTFTVSTTIAGTTTLTCSGTGTPGASGTLTKASGTGDATITFSSKTTTGVPVKGNTGIDLVRWKRIGRDAIVEYQFNQTSVGSGANGLGDYVWTLPVTADTTVYIAFNTTLATRIDTTAHASILPGSGHGVYATSDYLEPMSFVLYSPTQFRIHAMADYAGPEVVGAATTLFSSATSAIYMYLTVPVLGWQP